MSNAECQKNDKARMSEERLACAGCILRASDLGFPSSFDIRHPSSLVRRSFISGERRWILDPGCSIFKLQASYVIAKGASNTTTKSAVDSLSPLVPRRERGHFSDGGCIKMRHVLDCRCGVVGCGRRWADPEIRQPLCRREPRGARRSPRR